MSALGHHRYMWLLSAARSGTGSAAISSTVIVAYRLNLRCSGATLPVRLVNRHGGSIKIVPNFCPLERTSTGMSIFLIFVYSGEQWGFASEVLLDGITNDPGQRHLFALGYLFQMCVIGGA